MRYALWAALERRGGRGRGGFHGGKTCIGLNKHVVVVSILYY